MIRILDQWIWKLNSRCFSKIAHSIEDKRNPKSQTKRKSPEKMRKTTYHILIGARKLEDLDLKKSS
jgi:hypothetical protein